MTTSPVPMCYAPIFFNHVDTSSDASIDTLREVFIAPDFLRIASCRCHPTGTIEDQVGLRGHPVILFHFMSSTILMAALAS